MPIRTELKLRADFFQIFETRNIIIQDPEDQRTTEARPAFAEAEDEIFLQTFEVQHAHEHPQALEVEIAARNNNDDALTFEVALLEILQRINAERAR